MWLQKKEEPTANVEAGILAPVALKISEHSARSLRSLSHERRLRDKAEGLGEKIASLKRDIERTKAEKEKFARLFSESNNHMAKQNFDVAVDSLEKSLQLLSSYEGILAQTQVKLGQFTPTEAQIEARLSLQKEFAKHAAERLELDRSINGALATVRKLLTTRYAKTDRLQQLVGELDMDVSPSDIGALPQGDLLDSLPTDVLAQGKKWFDWFVSKAESVPVFVVIDAVLQVKERLTDDGHYRFGERIQLPAEEARELLRTDRPANKPEFPWRKLRPSIMTLADYEEVEAEAAREGSSVSSVLFSRFMQDDAKRREALREATSAEIQESKYRAAMRLTDIQM